MSGYAKGIVGLICVWFAVALAASALGAFSGNVNGFGAAVGVAALTPVLIFFIWYAASPRLRAFLMSLSPRTLTAVQSWRVLGFVFVLLEAHRLLPARFALPAGYGDMAIGISATFAAWKLAVPERRGSFILWQTLGIADLVMAVGTGITAPMIDPHGVSMMPMTVLPLSLIPTFFVPLLLMLHVISIAQARRWQKVPGSSRGPAAVVSVA